MKSIISHFYNEEYLLPWWLEHHKKYFDYGLMINYNSTDSSVDIIKSICPDWQIVDSINEYFGCVEIDQEVMFYENQIPGWKICLNTTEFILGDFDSLDEESTNKREIYVPSHFFVDLEDNSIPNENEPLYNQYFNAVSYQDAPWLRHLRCLHNHQVKYPIIGRHFLNYEDTCNDFVIFHYGMCPMNEKFIQRKLQIQHRIPEADKIKNWAAGHHNNNKGLAKEDLYDKLINEYRPMSKDISNQMRKFIEL